MSAVNTFVIDPMRNAVSASGTPRLGSEEEGYNSSRDLMVINTDFCLVYNPYMLTTLCSVEQSNTARACNVELAA